MSYKVFIQSGQGKNKSTSGSIPLPNKQRVSNYVKRSPIGNSRSKVSVTNTRTGKTKTGKKYTFYYGDW
jgi:hypothetical protein